MDALTFLLDAACRFLSLLPFCALLIASMRPGSRAKRALRCAATGLLSMAVAALSALPMRIAPYGRALSALLFTGFMLALVPPYARLCGRAPKDLVYCSFMAVNPALFLLLTGSLIRDAFGAGGDLERAALRVVLPLAALSAIVSWLVARLFRQHMLSMLENNPGLAGVRSILGSAGIYALILFILLSFGAQEGRFLPPILLSCVCLGGTCLSYGLNARLYAASAQRAAIAGEEAALQHLLDIQQNQYAVLSARFEEIRSARHDLRHHLSAMEQYVIDGDRARLEEYIKEYRRTTRPVQSGMSVCANLAVDSIVRHYLSQAMQEGVEVSAQLDIDENVGIPAPDLCIILGNCLENALQAVRNVPSGPRFIRIRSENTPNMLVMTIGNSYYGELVQRDGTFLSTKRAGTVGVGLSSIRTVAERHRGAAKFEARDNVFKTSVILFK